MSASARPESTNPHARRLARAPSTGRRVLDVVRVLAIAFVRFQGFGVATVPITTRWARQNSMISRASTQHSWTLPAAQFWNEAQHGLKAASHSSGSRAGKSVQKV